MVTLYKCILGTFNIIFLVLFFLNVRMTRNLSSLLNSWYNFFLGVMENIFYIVYRATRTTVQTEYWLDKGVVVHQDIFHGSIDLMQPFAQTTIPRMLCSNLC